MSKLIIYLVATFLVTSCSENLKQEELITVNGKIPVGEMGISLIHEHILVDFIGADSTGYHRWEKSRVIERALPFLMEAKQNGVNTFFECTPAYLGRDPLLLKELSEKTGMNIVTNTGYYGAGDNKYIPEHAFDDTPEDIAKVWINEFNNGIEGSGVFPGFIKISVDRNDTLSPMHAKIVKAAAITHKATGLTIVSHTGTDGPAFAQLEILKNEGVSPEAFVWTHAQDGTFGGYIKAAKQGAWISLDNVNKNNSDKPGGIEWYVALLTKLKEENVLHKILISHDAGWYNPGQANGGDYRSYTDIFDYLIPTLKRNGFSQEDINLLLIKNPQLAYAVNIRKINR
ncbi:phosphotriesterase family protein [Pontibacter pamirensis]|uniref:phosphotriesterase family protein n=1 Tax=Pontibacter pamirensis TaxID=2562824 RepID=UPI0013894D5D|nr:phosphotriesterase [Pontibacter pamirensis]